MVRLIVPYAPAGIVESVERLLAQRLLESFGENQAIARFLKQRDVQAWLCLEAEAAHSMPEAFARAIATGIATRFKVVKAGHIKIEGHCPNQWNRMPHYREEN